MKRMLLTLALVGALTAGTSCAGGGNAEKTESSADGKEKTEKVEKKISDGKPHLEFMGIPIDGSLKSFAARLEKRGLERVGVNDGIAEFRGEFAGFKDCRIGVVSTGTAQEVVRVAVSLPMRFNWRDLEPDYMGLKNMLSKKYGEPKECVENLEDLYSDSDVDKMIALRSGEGRYYAVFDAGVGTISLGIDGEMGAVRLDYADKVNLDKLRDQAMDDL